jgi:long-chain acyl-CoA synthetase
VKLGERVLSYAELDRAARSVAASLRARDIQPGDKVALLVPNVPEFTIAYFGILYAGAVVVPINVLAAAPEVTYFIEDSQARLLIAHPLFAEPARKGAAGAGIPCLMAGGGDGPETLEEMLSTEPVDSLLQTDADQTAVILYTSGTTG